MPPSGGTWGHIWGHLFRKWGHIGKTAPDTCPAGAVAQGTRHRGHIGHRLGAPDRQAGAHRREYPPSKTRARKNVRNRSVSGVGGLDFSTPPSPLPAYPACPASPPLHPIGSGPEVVRQAPPARQSGGTFSGGAGAANLPPRFFEWGQWGHWGHRMNRGFQCPHSISGSGDSGDKIGLIHSGKRVIPCFCLFFVQHGPTDKGRAPSKTGITFKAGEVRHRVTAGAGRGGWAACCSTWCGGLQPAQVQREKKPGPPPIRGGTGSRAHGPTAHASRANISGPMR